MVHLEIDAEDLPTHYQLLGVDVPDDLASDALDESALPADWREQAALTRALGDAWLREGATRIAARALGDRAGEPRTICSIPRMPMRRGSISHRRYARRSIRA